MDYTVFIQANEKQYIGALVAEYALKHNSAHAEDFAVRIMHTCDFPFLHAREEQTYEVDGVKRTWRNGKALVARLQEPGIGSTCEPKHVILAD